METTPFILALGKTLPASCLQGFAVYLVLQLLFLADKKSSPLAKFNWYYLANWFLFVGFLFTFFHYYQPIADASFSTNFSPIKTAGNFRSIIVKPNLWFQFNFWIKHYAYLITGFYLVGLVFCILKLTIGIIQISWFKNNKHLKLDENLTQTCIQLSTKFKLIKTVSVYVSNHISVPLTIGFLKPIIVFPIAVINQLSAAQTEGILLHELAHIKRHDYLLNLLLCIIQSFLFFNPAIWFIEREISKYREQCCDDLVLDQTQNQLAYAHALLLIEQYRSNDLNLTLASNGKKYTLLNRIKRITNMKSNDPSPQNKLVLVLLIIVTIGLSIAWNLPRKKSHILNKLKIEVTKSNGFKFTISADKAEIVKQNKKDTLKIVSDKFKFRPNNKSSIKYTITGNNLEFNPSKDTVIQSKNKLKIIMEDSLGNKKEYNSINELPEADQKEFLKQYWKADQSKSLNSHNSKIDTVIFKAINTNTQEHKKRTKEPSKRTVKSNISKEISISLKFPDSTKHTYHSKYIGSADLHRQTKEMVSIAKKQIDAYKKQINSSGWKEQDKNRKKVIDSARKNWKNSSDYQSLPVSAPIMIKPE